MEPMVQWIGAGEGRGCLAASIRTTRVRETDPGNTDMAPGKCTWLGMEVAAKGPLGAALSWLWALKWGTMGSALPYPQETGL